MALARAAQALQTGDTGKFVELQEAATAAFDEAGDARSACRSQVNVGFGFLEVGAFAEGQRALERARDDSVRMGLVHVLAAALHNLGWALARQGRPVEAASTELEAIETFRQQGDQRMEGTSRNYLASILADAGDWKGAEREAQLAVDLLEAAPAMRPDAMATLARILLAEGRTAKALKCAETAVALIEKGDSVEEGEARIRLVLRDSLEATGDVERAGAVVAAARDRLLRRADRLTDPRRRKSFLECVPEHARILALAGAPRPKAEA
jgi:tetratricopeptide (TPR) repeat protein